MPVVNFIAYEGCLAGSLSDLQDFLIVANSHWSHCGQSDEGKFRWQTLSIDGRAIKTGSGLTIVPDGALSDSVAGSVIAVPPIHYYSRNDFIESLGKLAPISHWIASHGSGQTVCGISTGSFLIGDAGRLTGRKCTTSWWCNRLFKERFPQAQLLKDEVLVEDGDVITVGPPSAEQLIAFALIDRYMGPQFSRLCAKTMLIDFSRSTQVSSLTLQRFRGHDDALVSRAQSMIEDKLHTGLTVEELSSRVSVHPRTLVRRFKSVTGMTPSQYHTHIRFETAKSLLETSSRSIPEIIYAVGFQDISSFSRLFKRTTGTTPKEYRQKTRNERS